MVYKKAASRINQNKKINGPDGGLKLTWYALRVVLVWKVITITM